MSTDPQQHDTSAHGKSLDNISNSSNNKAITLPLEDIRESIFSIVNALNVRPSSAKQGEFTSPFVLEDDILRRLNNRSEAILSDLSVFPGSRMQFHVTVYESENVSQSYDDFDRFLNNAGDDGNITKLTATWEQRTSNPFGAMSQINVTFVTNKSEANNILKPFLKPEPKIFISISGYNDRWVSQSYSSLYAIIRASFYGGIYAPLVLLRHTFVNAVCVIFVASYLFIKYSSEIRHASQNKNLIYAFGDNYDVKQILKIIHQSSDISEKIDIIARLLVGSVEGTELFGLYAVICLALLFAMSVSGFPTALLVPRSFIAIGLAKTFFSRYEAVFKFAVFTCLFSLFLGVLVVPWAKAFLGMPS